MTWTKPYCGVMHLGEIGDRRRATIFTVGDNTWFELHLWYAGCGFNPIQQHLDTLEEAKSEGERWIKEG